MANSWTTAEANLFTYFRTKLGNTENETAFAPPDATVRLNEYLPGFEDARLFMWTCWFEGGGDSADRGPTDGLPYIRGKAFFRGFFLSRDTARQYACAVAALTPVHNEAGPSSASVSNWYQLTIVADPQIRLATAMRKTDQAEKTGEVTGWLLEVQMEGDIKP